MIEDSIAPLTGHIQIHDKGFRKNMTLEYSFKNDNAKLEEIKKIKGVNAASPRISAGALFVFNDASAGGEILAVQPESEKRITTLHNYILPGGRYLEKNDRLSIVLGKNLADNLGVKTGDTVSLVSQGFDGSIAADNFTVIGFSGAQCGV